MENEAKQLTYDVYLNHYDKMDVDIDINDILVLFGHNKIIITEYGKYDIPELRWSFGACNLNWKQLKNYEQLIYLLYHLLDIIRYHDIDFEDVQNQLKKVRQFDSSLTYISKILFSDM